MILLIDTIHKLSPKFLIALKEKMKILEISVFTTSLKVKIYFKILIFMTTISTYLLLDKSSYSITYIVHIVQKQFHKGI